MNFLTNLSDVDSSVAPEVHPTLNSPPPLAEDEMDEMDDIDDVEDQLFNHDFNPVTTPNDSIMPSYNINIPRLSPEAFSYWGTAQYKKPCTTITPAAAVVSGDHHSTAAIASLTPAAAAASAADVKSFMNNPEATSAEKDCIVIVQEYQELPPSLENKRPFGANPSNNDSLSSLTSDLVQFNSNTNLLPWDAFVQSHINYAGINSDRTLDAAIFKPVAIQVNTATVHTKSEDFLLSPPTPPEASLLDLRLSTALLDQSINQTISQTVNQTLDHSLNHSLNHSLDHSLNQTINQSINPSETYFDFHMSIMPSKDSSPHAALKEEPSYSPSPLKINKEYLTPQPSSSSLKPNNEYLTPRSSTSSSVSSYSSSTGTASTTSAGSAVSASSSTSASAAAAAVASAAKQDHNHHKYHTHDHNHDHDHDLEHGLEPARTDQERKRRNRVYAKRSRDLKNQKYREAMDLNKDLQVRLKTLQEANQKLKLRNQRLEYEVKEFGHKFMAYENDVRWKAQQDIQKAQQQAQQQLQQHQQQQNQKQNEQKQNQQQQNQQQQQRQNPFIKRENMS